MLLSLKGVGPTVLGMFLIDLFLFSFFFWGGGEHHVGRASIVVIATRLRAVRSGVLIPAGKRDFPLFQNVQTGSGAQLPIQWVPGFFLGDKAARASSRPLSLM